MDTTFIALHSIYIVYTPHITGNAIKPSDRHDIKELSMKPEPTTPSCDNPNYFSDVLVPATEERLPAKGSIAGHILDHTTGIRPFFETVSQDLCDDARMSSKSGEKAVSFITRSTTSALVVGGTATLAALGLVVGSPLVAIGAGVAALVALPPLAEKAAFGVINYASDLLDGIKERRTQRFE